MKPMIEHYKGRVSIINRLAVLPEDADHDVKGSAEPSLSTSAIPLIHPNGWTHDVWQE